MRTNSSQARLTLVATAVAACALIALPAQAHVGTSPAEVPAGQTSAIAFRVGHGCDASPTIKIEMQIPAGVTGVVPRAKAGWTVEVEEGTLQEPVDVEGETITEGVIKVTWTGGPLDAHQYDEFELRARMPDTPEAMVYFPTIQTCEQGENAWIQIPQEGQDEPEFPAPGVEVVESTGVDEEHEHGDEMTEGEETASTDESESGATNEAWVWVALGLGGLGTVLGGVALATRRKA
ncbi:MAG TPA: YcnI family protein [Acidimicrobiia bacterium]